MLNICRSCRQPKGHELRPPWCKPSTVQGDVSELLEMGESESLTWGCRCRRLKVILREDGGVTNLFQSWFGSCAMIGQEDQATVEGQRHRGQSCHPNHLWNFSIPMETHHLPTASQIHQPNVLMLYTECPPLTISISPTIFPHHTPSCCYNPTIRSLDTPSLSTRPLDAPSLLTRPLDAPSRHALSTRPLDTLLDTMLDIPRTDTVATGQSRLRSRINSDMFRDIFPRLGPGIWNDRTCQMRIRSRKGRLHCRLILSSEQTHATSKRRPIIRVSVLPHRGGDSGIAMRLVIQKIVTGSEDKMETDCPSRTPNRLKRKRRPSLHVYVFTEWSATDTVVLALHNLYYTFLQFNCNSSLPDNTNLPKQVTRSPNRRTTGIRM